MRRLLILSILVNASFVGLSQQDFGIWSKIDLRAPIDKKFSAGIEFQVRSENNTTSINNSFLAPYAMYDAGKFLQLGVDYRLINEPTGDHFFGSDFTHRVTLDVEVKNLIDLIAENSRLSATIRIRGTHKTGVGDRSDDYLRSLFSLSYNVKGVKLEPEISGELFYHFNDQVSYTFNDVSSHHRLSEYRLRCKMNYEFSKRHSAFVGYFIEGRFESNSTKHVLNVGYRYTLKRLDKLFGQRD